MNVLFDTNVILDVLLDRKPFSESATILFSWAEDSISKLLTIFTIAPVNRSVLEAALNSTFSDFEDAVLYQAGCHSDAQAIVTRDITGFKNSSISVYSPDELVKMILALK